MINDFPVDIRREVTNFLDKHDRVLNLRHTYDQTKTALSQGFTPAWIKNELETIIPEFHQIQKDTVKYLPSNFSTSYQEEDLFNDVSSSLSNLVRLVNVIILENPELKDELTEVKEKYNDLYIRERWRRIDNTEIDTSGYLNTWDRVFRIECEDFDRVSGNIDFLKDLNEKYRLVRGKDSLRLDELIPGNLELLSKEDRVGYLKLACKPELFLDKNNLCDLINFFEIIDDYGYCGEELNIKELEDKFWERALDYADTVLDTLNIDCASPRLIRMALEIKYGGDIKN